MGATFREVSEALDHPTPELIRLLGSFWVCVYSTDTAITIDVTLRRTTSLSGCCGVPLLGHGDRRRSLSRQWRWIYPRRVENTKLTMALAADTVMRILQPE